MENQKKLFIVFASLAFLMCYNVLLYAQSVCVHSFKDNNSNIKSTAFKSVVLSNGDLVAAGYRKVNGYPKIVVDRYSFTSCSLVATYTLPYYSGPPATAPMQLLVNNNDFIGIRYFNTNAPGFNHFTVLDANLNLISTLVLGNSVTNRLMAFTNDGGVILTLLTSAPSYGEKLKVRRVLQNSLNNTVWKTVINFPNAEVRMVSDIKTDSVNNVYVTGCIESNSGVMKLFVLKLDASGQQEWIRSYAQNNSDWNDWLFTKLTIDKQQRVLIGSKSTDGLMHYLNIYCLAPGGALLWQKHKPTDTIHSDKVWIDTDSLCNVYAATHITGIQTHPSSLVYKFSQNGTDVWRKTISNFRVNSMKVNSGGNIYLAGDKYFTLINPPAYKAHFKLLNTDGITIGFENQVYTYDTNNIVSTYARYNDVAIKNNGDAYLAGERHDKNAANKEIDYYIIDSYENNLAPKDNAAPIDFAKPSHVYPNPAFDRVAISLDYNDEPCKFTICDLKGNVLIESISYPNQYINLNKLSSGIYVIKVEYNNMLDIHKLVKM